MATLATAQVELSLSWGFCFFLQSELLGKSKNKLLTFFLKNPHHSYFHHHHLLYMIVIKIVPQHKDDFTDNRSDSNVRLERVRGFAEDCSSTYSCHR